MAQAALTANETRDRILTEAERLFRHYGYAKTTVADIAEACAMSSANVYRFFASKSQINEAICHRITTQLEGLLRNVVQSQKTASEKLTQFINVTAEFTLDTLVDQQKVNDMVVAAMDENWSVIQKHIETTSGLISKILAEGMETGEFRKQDLAYATRCVNCAIVAVKHPVIVAQCREDPNYIGSPDEIATFILSALQA